MKRLVAYLLLVVLSSLQPVPVAAESIFIPTVSSVDLAVLSYTERDTPEGSHSIYVEIQNISSRVICGAKVFVNLSDYPYKEVGYAILYYLKPGYKTPVVVTVYGAVRGLRVQSVTAIPGTCGSAVYEPVDVLSAYVQSGCIVGSMMADTELDAIYVVVSFFDDNGRIVSTATGWRTGPESAKPGRAVGYVVSGIAKEFLKLPYSIQAYGYNERD